MNLFMMLLVTVMIPIWYIWPSRIISMTYKSFSKSITIKNKKLARMLIAEKNTWGIATDVRKRNKMSLWGAISYLVFVLPQVVFRPYHWWIFIKTGSGKWCDAEQLYFVIATLYYVVALSVKLREAIKYSKGQVL